MGRRSKRGVARAEAVLGFIGSLTNTAGPNAGKPFALRDWQAEIIKAVYGDCDPASGLRRARTVLLTMGRKNGKTELCAALALCHLVGPEAEMNGQIYAAAAEREQASLLLNAAASMARHDPEIMRDINIIDSRKRIVHYPSGSFFQALSSDAKTKHGFNASLVVCDELAQMPDRKLYDTLITSMGARAEPLTYVISTQSADHQHLMSELVDYGVKVRDKVIKDATFKPFIFSVPMDSDPWDEKNWYIANPGLNDFRSLQEMRQFAERAKSMPGLEATFRNLYLNQRADPAERAISSALWQQNGLQGTIDRSFLSVAYGGLDLSAKNDLTALVLVLPLPGAAEKPELAVISHFWTPANGIKEREDRDRAPYQLWRDQGYLTVVPGDVIDYRYVALQIGEIARQYDLREIRFDRWRIGDLKRELAAEGIAFHDPDAKFPQGFCLRECGQGFRDMSPCIEALEDALLGKRFLHGNNPILTWCASNAIWARDPAGNRKFDRENRSAKIDGIVAAAMAVAAAGSCEDQGSGDSVYEQMARLAA